jgi:holo-[acyl-carrier protein] synthase
MRTGVDLVEIARIQAVLDRYGVRFLRRVFTPQEIERYAQRTDSLAARWAGKEAVAKALGCGIGDIAWTDIEILSDEAGAPELVLRGRAATLAAESGLQGWSLSLSHTSELAIAFVIAW